MSAAPSDDLLRRHHVLVEADNAFQRKARLLQAIWREQHDLPMGVRPSGTALGSMLPPEMAKATLANYLTDAAKASVRREVAAKHAGSGQMIAEGRLYANLLGSQPLCFNLFAELAADLALASRVCTRLWPGRVRRVTAIRFEHSPSRGDLAFTDDHSAFDVFVEHETPDGQRGFLGIEVKYHESLAVKPARHRARYDTLTAAMGCYREASLALLRKSPLEQLWRDHMLAGAMLLDRAGGWTSGLYVFLYPAANDRCQVAVARYTACLGDPASFAPLTLEALVAGLARETDAPWVGAVRERYLAFEKLDRLDGAG